MTVVLVVEVVVVVVCVGDFVVSIVVTGARWC